MLNKEKDEDHPFPVKELKLIIRLNDEGTLPKEDLEIISNLFNKYLNLRSEVFHKN